MRYLEDAWRLADVNLRDTRRLADIFAYVKPKRSTRTTNFVLYIVYYTLHLRCLMSY